MHALRSALWTLGVALAAAAASGCADRVIDWSVCRDGFLARGEVCFAEATVPLRADFDPLAMRVGDFDGDAHQDALVVGVTPEGGVTGLLLPGDGTGRLGPANDANVFGCSVHGIPGDVDGDPATDLLVDDCGPSVLVFRGGAAGFGMPVSVASGLDTRTSAIVDADGDTHNDLVLLGTDASGLPTLNVVLGDGHGGFAPPDASPMPAILPGFDPFGFAFDDVDEDGRPDALLIDASETGGFALARGRGDGTFEPPTAVLASVDPGSLWLEDFDRDGHLDALVRAPAPARLVLARGDGRGGFGPGATTPLPDGMEITGARADLDVDGDTDLLFLYADRPIVEVWLGEGDGSFDGPTEIDAGGVPEQLAITDLDEDGAPDLVVGTFADGGIRVILARP